MRNGIVDFAEFNEPAHLVATRNGKVDFVTDRGNNLVCRIDMHTQEVITLAGGKLGNIGQGYGTDAGVFLPDSMRMSPDELTLYVTMPNQIVKFDISAGEVLGGDHQINHF